MKTAVVMQRYGGGDRVVIEVDADECPHCTFVHEVLKPEKQGDVFFVQEEDRPSSLRRVRTLFRVPAGYALHCEAVSLAEVPS